MNIWLLVDLIKFRTEEYKFIRPLTETGLKHYIFRWRCSGDGVVSKTSLYNTELVRSFTEEYFIQSENQMQKVHKVLTECVSNEHTNITVKTHTHSHKRSYRFTKLTSDLIE